MKPKHVPLDKLLKDAVRASGITMYRIAERAGITGPMLSRFMDGKRTIKITTADKIAKVLGLTLVASDSQNNK